MRVAQMLTVPLVSALSLVLNAGVPPAGQTGTPQASQRPMNILLLVIDDVRWDSLGAAGNKAIYTPRLDQLAAEGVRFRQARVTTSTCWVSRATLLTGQYMSRHGVESIGGGARGRGTVTTGRPAAGDSLESQRAGTDSRSGGPPGRGREGTSVAVGSISQEAYAQTFPALLKSAGFWTGFVGKWNLGAIRQTDWDFARTYEGRHWMTLPDGERIHVTEKNVRDALEFLHERSKDKPFVLDVSFFAAHAVDSSKQQYMPQDWSARFYEGKKIPPPLHGGEEYRRALPPFLSAEANEGRRRYHWRFDDTDERYQDYMKRYYRLITEVDAAIGRLIDELKAQGVYENTFILFISDNGYFQADRGLADKWYPYEESIRVPLIVRDPRLTASRRGKVRDEMALNIDVAPTILAAAGLPAPTVMQGQDLSRLYLQAKAPVWRDEFFYEMPEVFNNDRIPANMAVVRRDWKYVYWPDYDYEQLFDLKADPEELRNVASDPTYAAQRSKMKQKLEEWRQRVR